MVKFCEKIIFDGGWSTAEIFGIDANPFLPSDSINWLLKKIDLDEKLSASYSAGNN
jgi:hypothetical protein